MFLTEDDTIITCLLSENNGIYIVMLLDDLFRTTSLEQYFLLDSV